MSQPPPAQPTKLRHPLVRPDIALPLLALSLVLNLPFLHRLLRGDRPVTAQLPFHDRFDRAQLGPNYWSNSGAWRIVADQAHSPGVGNNPLWLQARLPENVRIRFTARSTGEHGDLKWEAFGDGRNHASGYIFIFGGWRNTDTRIAKLDEHAPTRDELQLSWLARLDERQDARLSPLQRALTAWDRLWVRRDLSRLEAGSFFGRETPVSVHRLDLRVEPGRLYREEIVRRGGVIRWLQDGQLVLELRDPQPLSGSGHDRFGFSSWQDDADYGDLSIDPLDAR